MSTFTTIALFNHKGGVGKSTIAVNLALGFAKQGYRTLVVDGDPQANASAFYLTEEDLDEYMEESRTIDEGQTLWSGISKAVRGRGSARPVEALEVDEEGVFLLIGDTALAPFEDRLAGAWKDCFSRDPAALDLVGALHHCIAATAMENEIDVVLLDVGPNIGSLNRVLLLGADYFVAPVACDLFSLRALGTLGEALTTWISDWQTIVGLADGLDVELLPGRPVFAGYITQHFNIYRSRATAPFEDWERRIAPRIVRDVVDRLRPLGAILTKSPGNKIGSIPAFHSLAPASQRAGLPIAKLRGVDGVNSGYNGKIAEADDLFQTIAHNVAGRLGI